MKKTYLLYIACRTRTESLINSFFFFAFISSRMPISNTFLLREKKQHASFNSQPTIHRTGLLRRKCLAVILLAWLGLTVMAPGKLVYWLVTFLHRFNHSLKQIRSRWSAGPWWMMMGYWFFLKQWKSNKHKLYMHNTHAQVHNVLLVWLEETL